jgi:hypothetical protein
MRSAAPFCQRIDDLILVCLIEMTLPEDFSGGIRGDGTADERWGADAARGAAGFGSAPANDDGSGAASGARAASGIPAFKDLPRRGSGGPEISKRRGRPSNRRKPEELRIEALSIIRKRYWDFGPTLAAEKLREVHEIAVGRETLRGG